MAKFWLGEKKICCVVLSYWGVFVWFSECLVVFGKVVGLSVWGLPTFGILY